MTELIKAARDLQAFCDARGWRSCIIGGLAVQHWGEPRFTRDVDVTLITGFGGEKEYISALVQEYQARIPNVEQFAIQNRVLLLQTRDEIGIDIALGAFAFEELVVERAMSAEIAHGVYLRICTAEDLIVLKAIAGRLQDWHDVRMILGRQQDKLDWTYIESNIRALQEIKEDASVYLKLKQMRDELAG